MTKLLKKYQHNEPLYKEILFHHDECTGNTGNLYVKRVPSGYIYFCHSCNFKGFHRTACVTSVKDTLYLIKQNKINPQNEAVKTVSLPSDFTTDIPVKGRIWLLKYMITDDDIKQYNIGYSEAYDRLILPAYKDNELVYWQGRNLGKVTPENPKYKNVRAEKNALFEIKNGLTCVLVEDILSAIRCSKYCSAIALLGSYISADVISIIRKYNSVKIFLDYDKVYYSINQQRRLSGLLSIPIKSIIKRKDPKEYANEKLSLFLKD